MTYTTRAKGTASFEIDLDNDPDYEGYEYTLTLNGTMTHIPAVHSGQWTAPADMEFEFESFDLFNETLGEYETQDETDETPFEKKYGEVFKTAWTAAYADVESIE